MLRRRPAVVASQTAVRDRLRALLAAEQADRGRPVLVLALDGVPHALAAELWRAAELERMRAVLPTTSSACWLSSLTGAGVAEHGVPGVVFALPDAGGPLVELFAHRGPLPGPGPGVFADAVALGVPAVAVLGDLQAYDCSWRSLLLGPARQRAGPRFFPVGPAGYVPPDPARLAADLRGALAELPPGPALLWCYVEVDQHVHHHGYDALVERFLRLVEEVAGELVARGAVVAVHADHGLVPTRPDPAVARLLADLAAAGCRLGGAGRARWVYLPAAPGPRAAALARLDGDLPGPIEVLPAEAWFPAGSLARRRVGDLLLVARGEDFVVPAGYRWDHGGDSAAERDVPFAVWS
jgi:hypothetical protein